MSENSREERSIWSFRFGRLPQEEEIGVLEEKLLEPAASFWDDALSLRRYLDLTGLSQSACAKALGRSQASVANRLRVLKLPERVRERMRAASLTERHARAILRLSGEANQLLAVDAVIRRGMNVAETERFVDGMTAGIGADMQTAAPLLPLLAELRFLRRTYPEAAFSLTEEESCAVLTIRLPKKMLSGEK